jgi:hypothetical protein
MNTPAADKTLISPIPSPSEIGISICEICVIGGRNSSHTSIGEWHLVLCELCDRWTKLIPSPSSENGISFHEIGGCSSSHHQEHIYPRSLFNASVRELTCSLWYRLRICVRTVSMLKANRSAISL